mmetsp:Transcript_13921/g.13915  ORF Transcript_13921/g.13915 Transcript_13921/m.13915 type:complete len:250 (+) Transcript_13921:19-768(+)
MGACTGKSKKDSSSYSKSGKSSMITTLVIPTNEKYISEFDLSAPPNNPGPNRKLLLDFYANSRHHMPNKLKNLFEAIFACEELKVIEMDLSYIPLDVNHIYQLLAVLEYFRNLKEINLSNVGLTSKDLYRLHCKLEMLTQLEKISISHNNLESEGGNQMERLLQHTVNIKYIDMSKTNLGDIGAINLSRGIINLKYLEVLILDNNDICEIGLIEILNTIKKSQTLCHLSLNNNFFTPKAGALLVNTIGS